MECNKDEAIRAKDIAVRKFTEKDFSGAKKFALKAQALYPGLEGISQMVTTLDVHLSAANNLGGETDFYGILGVNPLADDETIKKQYRSLVLKLHPDKNKAIGADGAFLFVTEAFNVLSDKAKRSAYNARRHIKMAQRVPSQSGIPSGASGSRPFPKAASQQKAPSQSGSSTIPPGVNGSRKHPGPTISRGKSVKRGTQKTSPQVQSFFTKGDTFWTVCTRCKMQYEYIRVYLDQMLKCPNCDQAFIAMEIRPPSNVSPIRAHKQPPVSSSKPGPHVSRVNNSVGGASASARWSPLSGTTAYKSNSTSAANSQPTGSQLAKESLKREREESHTGDGPSKQMRDMNGNLGWNSVLQGNKDDNKMIAEMALIDIRNRVRNWKLASADKASARANVKEKVRQNSKLAKSMQDPESHNIIKTDSQNGSHDVEQEVPEFIVPDPDFHVFDHDRLEHCFKENQVWAAYDNDVGMPRFYALIYEVASSGTFKLKLSWLNSRTNTEFGPLDWVGRGFRKNCGDFWVGRRETYDTLNSFSHRVKFNKGPRGVIQIYPQEGQFWALYRNWSPDWNENTPYKTQHAYEMVEVLQDYNEETGVDVAHIIKAPGFRTVYYKQSDPKVVKHIPKEEMFRFSHQVPHHILTGGEKPNAPKGFVELDPASTPAELLQETTSSSSSSSR